MNRNWYLNDGNTIPTTCFGTYQLEDGDEAYNAVRTALELGYRTIDTAMMYGNEASVGKAVRESGISRDDIFVMTKLHPDDQGYDSAKRALEESLKRMKLDYVDLYMIHWPGKDKYVRTWEAFEEMKGKGLTKSIGVCNFQIHHLEELRKSTSTVPAVNQVERHPFFSQEELLQYMTSRDMVMQAWGPLMRGSELLQNTELARIGAKYDKSPAQVVLRWHLETHALPIPKSSNKTRMRENIHIYDFSLTPDDLKVIQSLDEGKRLGRHPDEFLF